MRKKSDLQHLSANLQHVFGGRNWHLLWQTCELVKHWPEVAGKNIAEKSMPAYIRKKILWIYVHDSVWMQHLHARKTLLLDKVQKFNGSMEIEDIRWLLHPEAKPQEKMRCGGIRKEKIDRSQQKQFEKIASAVKNEQCRTALCKLWRAYHEIK